MPGRNPGYRLYMQAAALAERKKAQEEREKDAEKGLGKGMDMGVGVTAEGGSKKAEDGAMDIDGEGPHMAVGADQDMVDVHSDAGDGKEAFDDSMAGLYDHGTTRGGGTQMSRIDKEGSEANDTRPARSAYSRGRKMTEEELDNVGFVVVERAGQKWYIAPGQACTRCDKNNTECLLNDIRALADGALKVHSCNGCRRIKQRCDWYSQGSSLRHYLRDNAGKRSESSTFIHTAASADNATRYPSRQPTTESTGSEDEIMQDSSEPSRTLSGAVRGWEQQNHGVASCWVRTPDRVRRGRRVDLGTSPDEEPEVVALDEDEDHDGDEDGTLKSRVGQAKLRKRTIHQVQEGEDAIAYPSPILVGRYWTCPGPDARQGMTLAKLRAIRPDERRPVTQHVLRYPLGRTGRADLVKSRSISRTRSASRTASPSASETDFVTRQISSTSSTMPRSRNTRPRGTNSASLEQDRALDAEDLDMDEPVEQARSHIPRKRRFSEHHMEAVIEEVAHGMEGYTDIGGFEPYDDDEDMFDMHGGLLDQPLDLSMDLDIAQHMRSPVVAKTGARRSSAGSESSSRADGEVAAHVTIRRRGRRTPPDQIAREKVPSALATNTRIAPPDQGASATQPTSSHTTHPTRSDRSTTPGLPVPGHLTNGRIGHSTDARGMERACGKRGCIEGAGDLANGTDSANSLDDIGDIGHTQAGTAADMSTDTDNAITTTPSSASTTSYAVSYIQRLRQTLTPILKQGTAALSMDTRED